MTQNQVAYLAHLEVKRHNKEMEEIEKQQIWQRERESQRSVAEKYAELAVSSYHQSVAEAETKRFHTLGTIADLVGIWEKQREANVSLGIEQQKADNQTYYYLGQLMETKRHNVEQEKLQATANDLTWNKIYAEAKLGEAQLNEKSREYDNTYWFDRAKYEWNKEVDKANVQLKSQDFALDLLKYDQKWDEILLKYGIEGTKAAGQILGGGMRSMARGLFDLDAAFNMPDVVVGTSGPPSVIY